MPRLTGSTAAGAVALAILLALPAAAGAAAPGAGAAGTPAAEVGAGSAGRAATAAAKSLYFAGFSAVGVGDAATSADFKVPEFTCTDVDEGMVTTVWAISEEGDFLAGPDLFTYCAGGEFVLEGHVTTSGGQIPIWQDLQPGDKVRLSITKLAEGPSTHEVAFTSVTRGWTSSLPTDSPIERIEIGQRRMSLDGVSIPVPDYGRETFKNVVFDDVPLREVDVTRSKLVDDEGAVLVRAKRRGLDKFRLVSMVG